MVLVLMLIVVMMIRAAVSRRLVTTADVVAVLTETVYGSSRGSACS